MIIVGVDPGKQGAFVAIDEHGALRWWFDIPALASRFDTTGLVRLFAHHTDDTEGSAVAGFIEWQQPSPNPPPGLNEDAVRMAGRMRGGTVANFVKGHCFGLCQMLFAAHSMRYECPKPSVWQREVLPRMKGKTKERSALIASQLFPSLPIRGPRGALKDGRADAACIAEYGRRFLLPQRMAAR